MSASVDAAEGLVSAHEATTTFDCKTPGCTGQAKTAAGRHCYCRDCQIKRGTASADGTMIHKPSPPSSGSAISRGGRHDNPGAGSYERKVLQLAAAARELDLALRSYRDAKPRLERAIQSWRSALVMFRESLAASAADSSPRAQTAEGENGRREAVHELAEGQRAERPDPRPV